MNQYYPSIEVIGVLNKILEGVGDVIASRLEACWEILSFEMGDDIKSVTKVKETLTKEKTVYIFDATKKVVFLMSSSNIAGQCYRSE